MSTPTHESAYDRVWRAINQCPTCQQLTENERREQSRQALRDVKRTQARKLQPFPDTLWTDGRPYS